ncbi:MAG: PEP-CTERM sorting domain-containing protein [Pirellulales bacterium]
MLKLSRLALPVLLFIASDLRSAEPSFTPLPDLPGGGVGTFVIALSANGEVAVGFSRSDLNPNFESAGYPFRWTADTGMVALSEFPGHANGVSADGSVVVGSTSVPGSKVGAFRWTAGADIVLLEGVNETGRDHAYSVSDDGRFVGGLSSSGSLIEARAVRWVDGGSPMELGVPTTLPVFVSADGSIAAGTDTTPFAFDAFRWTAAEGVTSLGTSSSVRDMTPDGRVIVGAGFRWTLEGGLAALPFNAEAMSDDGSVMVGTIFGSTRPGIWFDGTVVDLQPYLTGLGLDLTGWTLGNVDVISGDGMTIAGRGLPPDPSMSGAWIATIPEPSTWLLGGIALSTAAIGVLLRRRRALCAAR